MLIEHVVWLSRLVVSAVFAVAAWGKLTDRAATRRSVGEFGVPDRFVPSVVFILPATELMVAVTVLLPWTALWASCGALGLMLVFSAAVVAQLASGRQPSCACFGALSSAPISRWTLARNAAIAAAVGFVMWGAITRPKIPVGLPGDHAVGLVVITAMGVALVWQGATIRTLRAQQSNNDTRRKSGSMPLPVAAIAPDFDLPATSGGRSTLDDVLAAGLPAVLLFMHPGCVPCADIADELPRWRERTAATLTFVAIGSGTVDTIATWAGERRLGNMLVQDGFEIGSRYRLDSVPSAVLINPDGRIAAPAASGPTAIRELVATTSIQPTHAGA